MSKTREDYILFDKNTKAFVYGYQTNAIQRMLDFDYICKRSEPSIAAIINPSRAGIHKAFWGSKEIILPMYRTIGLAAKAYPQADTMVNFASHRSAFETTMEALAEKSIRVVAVIAEGVPERQSRIMSATARKEGKVIIGPATVGGMVAGAFRIGNTAGTIENIIASKLYRPGCVGFVSKSGGMLNEAFNIISRNSDGIYEGIAIGGDRHPGSTMLDHILRYEANPAIKMIACLGELGGEDEYRIIKALQEKRITKPLVAWVTGTCAPVLPASVQFGHAGAKADTQRETAQDKTRPFAMPAPMCPHHSTATEMRSERSTSRSLPQASSGGSKSRRCRSSPWTTAGPWPRGRSESPPHSSAQYPMTAARRCSMLERSSPRCWSRGWELAGS